MYGGRSERGGVYCQSERRGSHGVTIVITHATIPNRQAFKTYEVEPLRFADLDRNRPRLIPSPHLPVHCGSLLCVRFST
jgi:hypothetical protein